MGRRAKAKEGKNMIQQGFFEDRIKELDEREQQLSKEYVQVKMSLNAVRKEKEKAFEYMNSAKYAPKQDTSGLENEITSLKRTLNQKDKTISKMNNTINQKNGKIKSLNKVIKDKDHEISVLQLKNSNEQSKLQEEIAELNILQNRKVDLKKEEIAVENRELKKQNRGFKRDIKALNERIEMMDTTIQKKNNEIQILHERLNWQPAKTQKNIFEEFLEAK